MGALLLAALVAATPAPGQHGGQSRDLSGAYSVEGHNPGRSVYSGTLFLTLQGPRYIGEWVIAGQSFRRDGTFDGRVLTVNWAGGSDPVVHVLMPDGELHGIWADGHALDRREPAR